MNGRHLKIKEILWLVSIGAMSVEEAEEKITGQLLPLFETIDDQDDRIIALEAELAKYS